jgi:toxin-antitoxin system PIN domain toxin
MRFLVDTNILLYALHRGFPQHAKAKRFLDEHIAQQTRWCTTWPIVYEFLRVATHPKVFDKPLTAERALAYVQPLFDSGLATILNATDRHFATLEQTIDEVGDLRRNVLHDVHTAVLMREHGVQEIVTADADFREFAFLKVTNPVAA